MVFAFHVVSINKITLPFYGNLKHVILILRIHINFEVIY